MAENSIFLEDKVPLLICRDIWKPRMEFVGQNIEVFCWSTETVSMVSEVLKAPSQKHPQIIATPPPKFTVNTTYLSS